MECNLIFEMHSNGRQFENKVQSTSSLLNDMQQLEHKVFFKKDFTLKKKRKKKHNWSVIDQALVGHHGLGCIQNEVNFDDMLDLGWAEAFQVQIRSFNQSGLVELFY